MAVRFLIGIMVALIVLLAVLLPVISDVTSSLGLTGPAKTVADLFPLLLVVAGLIWITKTYEI
jgi:hypothetical protein